MDMRRVAVCWWLSGAVLGIVALRAIGMRWDEPTFKGKPVRTWARLFIANPFQRRAELLSLGARVVPYLVDEIERERPPDGSLDRLWLSCYLRRTGSRSSRSTVWVSLGDRSGD